MNFDDRFLGIMNMLGNMGGKKDEKQSSKSGINMESMMGILGLMQGLQNSQMSANGQGNGGLDIMKILPLLSALKGGFPMGNTPNVNAQSAFDNDFTSQNTPPTESTNTTEEKTEKGGYKDKYSAISFAGNEVIYTLGKLWKTYKV